MTTPLAPETPDLATFGAPYRNADAVEDPETDVAAEALNRLIAQVCMLSGPAVRARARVSVSGGLASVVAHDAVWGSSNGVRPSATRSSAGIITVAWAAEYDDQQATPESHPVQIRFVDSVTVKGTDLRATYEILSASSVKVYVRNSAGTLTDPDEFCLAVA